MRLDGNKVTLETKECISCQGTGRAAKQIPCPACKGTGRGIKGGKNGCRKCSGFKTAYSSTETVTCGGCEGTGKRPENDCDSMPDEWFASMPFRVYRHNREQTYNEYLLGIGCVYSCTDYGRAYAATDDKVIAEVSSHTFVQLCKVARNLTLCDHIGIFVNRDGYSVRAVYLPDAKDALTVIANERGKDDGFQTGSRLASEGLNGTIGAIYK